MLEIRLHVTNENGSTDILEGDIREGLSIAGRRGADAVPSILYSLDAEHLAGTTEQLEELLRAWRMYAGIIQTSESVAASADDAWHGPAF